MFDWVSGGVVVTGTEPSPFHVGEQQVQTRLGVREEIEPWARQVVRPVLPEGHRAFYAALPYVVAAARDREGRPWVTMLAGEPGFMSSPEPTSLVLGAVPRRGDALAGAFVSGADVGLLGIELHTRRRNRVNGRVAEGGGSIATLTVEQAYGNCPQYIHPRAWRAGQASPSDAPRRASRALSPRHRRWITEADTFFIASGYRGQGESPAFGMDASHRGGVPGFVVVDDERQLRFPDYAGNNHFNTIGNLSLDPRVGLLFVDFARGDFLQVTGRATIAWEAPDLDTFPGARRIVEIAIEEVVESEGALPLQWDAPGDTIREIRVIAKERESEDVVSFVFEPRDGAPAADFVAGQYLPIDLDVPGQAAPVARTYSLSGRPGDSRYRITVKRDPRGLVSRHLHDHVEVGAILSARDPQGEFTLDVAHTRPVVLVSAGVGVTPMVSMLHALATRTDDRLVWFVHGARDGRYHPLAEEVRGLAADSPQTRVHVAYSRPRADDVEGRDYDTIGRVDGPLLERLLPGLDAEFYLCGPTGFMAAVRQALGERGVVAERIHSESFGPSS